MPEGAALSLCPQCRRAFAEKVRLTRQERLGRGMCRYCGLRPHLPKRKGCSACLRDKKAKQRTLRDNRKSVGYYPTRQDCQDRGACIEGKTEKAIESGN